MMIKDDLCHNLDRKITAKEVKTAVWEMANNKAPSKDNINVKLIKYAPEEIYKEIANILNGIYERNDTRTKLGTSTLLPLPKPKKVQGSVKELRPIILLEVIQKILSKIFINSTEDKINKYVPNTECIQKIQKHVAWAHRWMSAKI